MKTSDTIAEAPAPAKPLPARVLIADDQVHILEALELLLKSEGYRLHVVRSPAELLLELSCENFDAALIDLNYTRDTTSGSEGIELLQKILGYDSQLPVVVMTAWGNIDLAVEAIRHGARDFIQKPWENARLLTVLRTQIELSQALRRSRLLEAENLLLRASNRPEFIATAPLHAVSA